MHYLSVFDHKTNKRVAFLENAYNIGYRQENNALWTAQFTLPLKDPKNRHCKVFNFVEVYDGDKYIGLFRIIPKCTTKSASTNEVVYDCEHVIATLMDDVLLGWHEIGNLGVYTNEVLRYILERQTVKRWQLGVCEFSRQFLYGWENENLLSSLFSVPKPFSDDYCWEFETSSFPWTVNLKKAPAGVKAEIRYRKNMLGITKGEDATNLCTRLYPLGYGEGTNQLTIESVNNGRKYIDADTIDEHGVVTKIWIDQRYQHAQSLYDAAVKMLESLKTPALSYDVESVHTKELLDRNVGDYVRVVDDELGVDIITRIISITKNDVVGRPADAKITIANKSASVATTIADLADRQRITEAYSQGAVTLFTTHFYDNCSPQYPAELRFYVPNNVVHINQILLNGNAAAFRGYTKATKGGGARAATTGSGGGSYTSTASGGGSSTTSGSGGGSSSTSDGVTLYSSNTVHDTSDNGGPGGANHNHALSRGDKIALTDGNGNIVGYRTFVPSGKHTHPAHRHTVNIPSHSHSVSIPSHSHSVSVPAHSHSFSVPDHTHEITYGIYSGSTASKLTLKVDNTVISTAFGSTISDLNLIDYLSKEHSGNITRGWHTIRVTPDVLSRVEFDLVIQLFANSRGGGQY